MGPATSTPREPLALVLLRLLALALAPLVTAAQDESKATPPDLPPDVLIVLADDLGLPELSATPTPNLEALARDGVVMTSFYGMPICSPGRCGLLFGRWPRRSGVGGNVDCGRPSGPDNATPSTDLLSLPELFAKRGYHTALVGKWHLGQAPASDGVDPCLGAPKAHGFEHWLAGAPANLRAGDDTTGYLKWRRVDDGVERIERVHATVAMRDAALDWWAKTPSPKFLLVSLSAPHQPLCDPPAELLPEGQEIDRKPGNHGTYLAMVSSVDNVVGRLRAVADPARTLFLFLADNGTAPIVFDAKMNEAKGTACQRGIHVPFYAAGPNIARGERCDAVASIVDVMATLAEATGPALDNAGPGGEDSRSFWGALVKPASWTPPRPWVMAERFDEKGDDLCVLDGRWKLRRTMGQEVLVDLASDPRDERPLEATGDLDPEQRAALTRLRTILEHEVPPRQD